MHAYLHTHACAHCLDVSGQPVVVISFLPPHESQKTELRLSGLMASAFTHRAIFLPSEPSSQSQISISKTDKHTGH